MAEEHEVYQREKEDTITSLQANLDAKLVEFEDLKKDQQDKSNIIIRLEETNKKIEEDIKQIRREANNKLGELKDKNALIEKREEECKNLKERITESETNFEELKKQYTELKQEFKVGLINPSLSFSQYPFHIKSVLLS